MKMKNSLSQVTLALILIVVFSSSCNSGEQKYDPVKDREPRISSLGFSIVPPPGENWLESFADQSIYYIKKINPEIQSFYTGATEIKTSKSFATAEDFLIFVKEKKDFNKYPNRYQKAKNEYKIDTHLAPFCVSYVLICEDHEAKNLGGNKFLLMSTKGLICMHPDYPKVGVDVYYSDRSVPNQEKKLLEKEGEAFIQSLKFLPLNQK
jgi:hypothetical protein